MECISCGKKVEAEGGWVEFPCPQCGKVKILRCEKCKKIVNEYVCPSCGFRGP